MKKDPLALASFSEESPYHDPSSFGLRAQVGIYFDLTCLQILVYHIPTAFKNQRSFDLLQTLLSLCYLRDSQQLHAHTEFLGHLKPAFFRISSTTTLAGLNSQTISCQPFESVRSEGVFEALTSWLKIVGILLTYIHLFNIQSIRTMLSMAQTNIEMSRTWQVNACPPASAWGFGGGSRQG